MIILKDILVYQQRMSTYRLRFLDESSATTTDTILLMVIYFQPVNLIHYQFDIDIISIDNVSNSSSFVWNRQI
jgi:hypothetical protein